MSAGIMARMAAWNWGRLLMALALAGAAAGTWWQVRSARLPDNVQQIVLLLPDAESNDPVQVQAWQDAAEELGIHLVPRTASQVMRALSKAGGVGPTAEATVAVQAD